MTNGSALQEGRGLRGRLDARCTAGGFRSTVWCIGAVGLVLRLVLGRFEPLPPTKIGPIFKGAPPGPLVADETWYVHVAHNLLDGRGFVSPVGTPTALHGPLTVLLLIPATLLQPHGYSAQRATMALLGSLSVVVIAYVARELAGPRAGLLAAATAAVYAGLWINDLVATSETPAVLLLSIVLLLALRIRYESTTRRLVLVGVAIGLLALDRGELAILALAFVIPALVVAARRSPRPAVGMVRALAVVGVLALAVVTPWSVYNAQRFHQFVPISEDLGPTLVGANCPQSYYGPLTGYDGTTCFYPVAVALKHAQPRANEAAADAYFRSAAVTYATDHASRWPVVAVYRELWLWSLWRPSWTVYMSGVYIGRPSWLSWTQIASFWLLTPLALLGLLTARRRRVRVAELVTMVGFTALLGLVVVGHLRYRISAEVAWVVLAAIGFDRLLVGQPPPDLDAASA